MNHIYRIIFDRQQGVWKVASEHARGQGKTSGRLARSTQTGRKMPAGQALAGNAYFALRIPRWVSVTMLTGTLAFAIASPSLAQTCSASSPSPTCTGNEVFEANSDGAISTDWRFEDNSILNASATNAVSYGWQYFNNNSTLNASAANAVSDGRQYFYNNSTLNASAEKAVSGGIQGFWGTSTLNASADNAVSGGTQWFYDTSTLNASAANAISGGLQLFDNTLNASATNAVSLNASAANAVSGGTQIFNNTSTLNASAANAVSGGRQEFYYISTLNASVANAVSGGTQVFYDTSTLNASVANAVSGGTQVFYGPSTLNASVANAVSGGTQVFYDTSTLSVGATNALSQATDVSFENRFAGGGGTLVLNGYSTVIGRINSVSVGSGFIANNNATDAVLTVDGTQLGDSLFSGIIANGTGSGTLALHKTGNSTLALSGVNTYTGGTTVSGGTLLVNGSIASSSMTTVASGATLGGNGTLGNTFIASGATLAPGGVGTTLTVDGDLTIASGATYQLYADPSSTQSTLVNVTGTAFLQGGAVRHMGPNGTYKSGINYTILTADNGVTGQFTGIDSNYAYLKPSLTYTPTTVTMVLERKDVPPDPETRPIRFADAANTRNQRVTADALESLDPHNSLYQFIETLPSGAPPAVFDSLSGEVHATTNAALRSSVTGTRALTFKHLRNNLTAVSHPGAPTAQAGTSDAPALASSLPQDGALPAWAEVVGNWQTLDSDDNVARATQRTGGLFVGADHAVGNGWRVGGALGYTDSTLRVNDRNSKARLDSYSATLYGGKAFEVGAGKLNLLMGTAYTWHTIDTERHATVSGTSQKLKADYRANTTQLFTELGYAMPVGSATLEPFVGVAWSKLQTRGFSESGGSAALSGRSQSDDQTTTTLGLRAQTPFAVGTTNGTVRGSVGWRHAFGGLTPQSTLAFNGSQSFTVLGTPIARDAALLELGADIAISRNATLGVSYGGQFASGSREHTGSVNMRWRF